MPPPRTCLTAHRRLSTLFLIVGLPALPGGCTEKRPEWMAVGRNGAVASDSAYASQVGLEVLKAGGNAIDAATAVSFTLAVTRPESTGLGGGGFLILRTGSSGQIYVFDFRESAPAAARADMYVQARAAGTHGAEPSRYGHLAVAVPGLVAGRAEVHRRFGTRPWAELVQPAVRLAREGFPVDAHYVECCADVLTTYEDHPWLRDRCPYVYRVHLRKGDLRRPGDLLIQPELGRLLEKIGREGPDVFYQGEVADALTAEMRLHGGILAKTDLADYRVIERRPIVSTYRDYRLILMPPPSSGGICIAESLNILETVDLPTILRRDAGLGAHYLVEAMKHAFADRARWLGDTDFVSVPTALLTSKAYAGILANAISPEDTNWDPPGYGAVTIPKDAGTSHFCVVDRWGNAVVSTETINTSFGSLAAVDQWGLILNNEMDDFTAYPASANAFGLIQSRRNGIEAGKRPLSSMAPTIVLKGGKPYLLIGASGGPRIISSVLNVLLGLTDGGLDLKEAMTAPRVHHQFQPDEVVFDRAPSDALASGLTSRGHSLSERRRTGMVQCVLFRKYQLMASSDPRKGGQPAGY